MKQSKEIKELLDKFHEEMNAAVVDAAEYRIKTYEEMVNTIRRIDMNYEGWIEDLGGSYRDLDTDAYMSVFGGEEHHNSLQFTARLFLKACGVVEKVFNEKIWMNDDGFPCDEYGRALTNDGEHHVFEVIKGGKYDSMND